MGSKDRAEFGEYNKACVKTLAASIDHDGWSRWRGGDWVELVCPECGSEPGKRTLHLNIPDGAGQCWRKNKCGWSGTVTELAERHGVILPDMKREDLSSRLREVQAPKYQPEKAEAEEGSVETTSVSIDWRDKCRALQSNRARLLDLERRGISGQTAEKYRVGLKGESLCFPYFNSSGDLDVYKIKTRDKRFTTEPPGVLTDSLFGSHLISDRSLVFVTEGEEDAMSLFDLLGGQFGVVSVRAGAASASASASALRRFREIVLVFDNDKAGVDGSEKLALLLQGKARVAHLPLLPSGEKDVCDFVGSGRGAEVVAAIRGAERYTLKAPDSLHNLGSLRGFNAAMGALNDSEAKGVQTHLSSLNELMGGLRPGEITGVTAHTGAGKSAFTTNLCYRLSRDSKVPTLIMSLELLEEDVWGRIYQQETGKFLHERNDDLGGLEYKATREDVLRATKTMEQVPLQFLSSERLGIEDIFTLIDASIESNGTEVVVLDHLHFLRQSADDGLTSHEKLSDLMFQLKAFVMSRQVHLILVAHISRAARDKEMPSLRDFSGSSSIEQIIDNGLVLRRVREEDRFDGGVTEISLQKLRRASFGRLGERRLLYSIAFESFEDLPDPEGEVVVTPAPAVKRLTDLRLLPSPIPPETEELNEEEDFDEWDF